MHVCKMITASQSVLLWQDLEVTSIMMYETCNSGVGAH